MRSSGGTDHSTASSSRAGISLMRFILASAADTGDADTGDADTWAADTGAAATGSGATGYT